MHAIALIVPALADSEATKDPALQDADLLPCTRGLYLDSRDLVPFLDPTII